MSDILGLKELFEKRNWFTMYYFKEEGKINIEYVLGYDTEPSKDDIAIDSYGLVEELDIDENRLKDLHVHVMDKAAMQEVIKALSGV